MSSAAPRSWLAIGTRIGGMIAAVLVLLVVGAGVGHITLSNLQAVLGFAIATRDDGPAALQVHDRPARHAAGHLHVRHAVRRDLASSEILEGDARRRSFAQRRGCRDRRHCHKASDAGDVKTL